EFRDRRLELINGEIVEKVTSEEHGLCASMIHIAIGIYLKTHPIGRVTQGVHFRAPDQDTHVLIPDVAVTVDARAISRRGSVPRLPDLAVEVKSPANTLSELREKAHYYLSHGTRIVWLVLPAKRLVIVLTPTGEDILDAADTLTGGDVLPGFTLPVAEIFQDTQTAGRQPQEGV
ncbi:MAG: Uma2 family endonuclease, partial [Candidatus Flexifilum sp.]